MKFTIPINREDSLDEYINNWRTDAYEQKIVYAQNCLLDDINQTPHFNRGIYTQHEKSLNFTEDGPLAFGLSSERMITVFNYGNEEIQIYKSYFTHKTLRSSNSSTPQEESNQISYCDMVEVEKQKDIIDSSDESNGNPFFGYSDYFFPGRNGTCESTIPPKSSCLIELSYSPKELLENGGDTHFGSLVIQYNDILRKILT